MHSENGLAGAGVQTALAPHAVATPVGAQARALVVHVAGGTLGIWVDAAPQLPPDAWEERLA
jgi:hypothetical protein